jgi:hypothetical protein
VLSLIAKRRWVGPRDVNVSGPKFYLILVDLVERGRLRSGRFGAGTSTMASFCEAFGGLVLSFLAQNVQLLRSVGLGSLQLCQNMFPPRFASRSTCIAPGHRNVS